MAKQRGIFKVEGTIDEVSFYKSRDGYMMRQKGGVSAERMATDPAFARTRENQQEFARAGRAGKVLKSAFKALLVRNPDRRMGNRLFTKMMQVLQADATSARGERTVTGGDLSLLQGFEFNSKGKLSDTLYVPATTSIDRTTGSLSVDLPAFIPNQLILSPTEATHYKLVTAGGHVDFTTGTNGITVQSTAALPLGNEAGEAVSHAFEAGADNPHPLFLVLGITFWQNVNGVEYPLNNGSFNALGILKVDVA